MNMAWAWGILGLVLLATEMTTGTFYMLWFGIAGLILCGVVTLSPGLSLPIQLLIYAMASLVLLLLGKQFFKRSAPTDLKVGQSHGDEIGRIGTIIETVSPDQLGRIKFTQGLMGSREWRVASDVHIDEGQQAYVVAVEGNSLRVAPSAKTE